MDITNVHTVAPPVWRNRLPQGGDTIEAVAHGMIEDVHGAIFDLVQLIKTYQSKNKLSKVFMSTLFKRRQEELDAVVDQAIMRLQVSQFFCFRALPVILTRAGYCTPCDHLG